MIEVEQFKQALAETTEPTDLYEVQRVFINELANGSIKTLEGAIFLAKLIDNRKL